MSSQFPAPIFMATVLPGLEDIAADEITKKVKNAVITDKKRGKVFFASDCPCDELMNIRTMDNLYHFMNSFTLGPHKIHLNDLEKLMTRMNLSGISNVECFERETVKFVVNSSRSGKHSYSRFDLSSAAVRGILKQHPSWREGSADDHELEFRLDLIKEQGLFSLRLTQSTFRFRGYRRMFVKTALRPPVAHSLVWISKPRKDECFIDPFCGSGTILAERVFYPAKKTCGGDISTDAVSIAKQNIPSKKCVISQWDATNLPIEQGSVDTVVTNLPFGRRVLNRNEIGPLYHNFSKELRRILTSKGQAILLTDQLNSLQKAANKQDFRNTALLQLSLKGLHPWVVALSRQ